MVRVQTYQNLFVCKKITVPILNDSQNVSINTMSLRFPRSNRRNGIDIRKIARQRAVMLKPGVADLFALTFRALMQRQSVFKRFCANYSISPLMKLANDDLFLPRLHAFFSRYWPFSISAHRFTLGAEEMRLI